MTSILIVDDDADIRGVLAELLESEGYATATAANGREALAQLERQPHTALILLDLMMPMMNGFEFRAAQRADPAIAAIPVVVMTAGGAYKAETLGVREVLAKPLEFDELLGALTRARDPRAAG